MAAPIGWQGVTMVQNISMIKMIRVWLLKRSVTTFLNSKVLQICNLNFLSFHQYHILD